MTTKYLFPLTKFLIPLAPKDAVQRVRLIQKINEGVQRKLVLISAPAGYGKSTLVAQWQAQTSLLVAWITLDREDNNPTNFANSLLNSLNLCLEASVEQAVYLPDLITYLPLEEAEAKLSSILFGSRKEIVLVLDDYHHIESHSVHHKLCDLMQAASPRIHFVIISRTRPPLSVNFFRVRRQLIELSSEDLRFNQEEVQDFFLRMNNLRLTEEELYNLLKRSEGWIACLQLAALSMQNMSSAEMRQYLDTFTSSNRYVWDYLIEEVYSKLPEHIQEFMQETSILRRLCAPLCDEVTDSINSREILEYLDRSNLITPLEDKRNWFRYPALIAEFLYEMLERRRGIPATFELHRRAAHWYENIGELGEAAHHAYAALDSDHANLLLNRIQSSINLGDYAAWQYSFLDLPDEILREQPDVCFNCAVSLMLSNDLENFERPLNIAEQVWQAQGNKAKLGQIYNIRAIINRYEGDYQAAIRFSEKALEFLPDNEKLLRSGCEHVLAMAHFQGGRVKIAEALLPGAIQGLRECGENYSADMALAGLARVQMASGKLRLAEETYKTVVAFTDGKVYDQVLSGHVFLGSIYYEWNRLDLAEQHLNHAFKEPAGRIGRYWPLAYIYLALIHFARGDQSMAAKALDEAMLSAEKLKRFGWQRIVKCCRAWLALRVGDLSTAYRWFKELEPLVEDDLGDYHRFQDWLILIRFLISQGALHKDFDKLNEAARLLQILHSQAEEDGRGQDQIRLLVLRAIALWNLGDQQQALTALNRAFSLAEPEGYIRTFLDEGEKFADLLNATLTDEALSRYAKSLRSELHSASELYFTFDEMTRSSILLSPREIEILQAIARGMNTQAIAEHYYLSPFTVRTHIKRIFEKLGVHSRLQAVEQGRLTGLL